MGYPSRDYPSKSSSSVYTVRVGDNGLLQCNCRGWVNKRPNKARGCTHTEDYARLHGLSLVERDGQMFVADGGDPAPVVQRGVIDGAPTTVRHVPAPSLDERVEAVVARGARGFVEPMLASKLPDGWDADRYAASDFVMEEKFDGHRIVACVTGGVVSAWSRAEKSRTLPAHVRAALARIEDGTYDGELVVPGGKSYSVTAGQNSGREVLVLFDLIEVHGQSVAREPLSRRRALLEVAATNAIGDAVVLSEQFAPSQSKVAEIWARGGEGAMIKRLDAPYRPNWRSESWVKVKLNGHEVVVVVGYESGSSGPYSAIQVTDGKVQTTVKTKNNLIARQIAADPESFIGRRLVISFQTRTESGSWRHPMFDHWAATHER